MKHTPQNIQCHWLLSFLLAVLAFFGLAPKASAAPSVVEEYFIPFNEDDILNASKRAYSSGAPANCGGNSQNPVDPIRSFTSFVVAEDNTIIVYDHWEDGYEAIPNIKTQSTTEIWGDGDLTNGVAPGHPNDLLSRGDVVTLKNDVVSTTRQAVIDYDGGDHLVTSGALSVTRSGWATGSETLMAGATEVYPTALWGTSYKLPVGEDYVMNGNTPTNNRFEYTAATIQAAQDNTEIQIDSNADGTVDTSVTINKGESYYVNGGLLQNATIVATKPVFVVLFTADKCATYEADWYILPHLGLYSSSYLGSVGTPTNAGQTQIHVHNPNNTAITVNWFTQGPVAQTPLSIPANSAVSVVSPDLSGQRFTSTGGQPFIAFASISADLANSSTWDWGYTLVPFSQVTNQILSTAWSPGRDPNSSASPNANVSPIWLTVDHKTNPASTATVQVCVDFNNDGGSLVDSNGVQYDQQFTVIPLDSQRIYDPDGDQTAMRLWVCDGSDAVIAAAWGEDPNTAPTGAPSLDLGVTVLNGVPFSAGKNVVLSNDVNGNGLYDVGDTVRYTISVRNAGALPLTANTMLVTDEFPVPLTYVTGSSTQQLAGGSVTAQADDASGTAFPFDGAGLYVPVSIPPFSEYFYTFDGLISTYPVGGNVVNNANVSDPNNTRSPSVSFPVTDKGTISGSVFADTDNNNTGDAPIAGVTLKLFTDPNGDGDPSDGVEVGSDTTTNNAGAYSFTNVSPGKYVVVETQPSGYLTVTDGDTTTPGDDVANASTTDNRIPVTITAGETDNGNNFVEEQPGSIAGTVRKDTNNDNIGDAPISGVTLTLIDGSGNPVDSDPNTAGVQPTTTTTAANGSYSFTNLPPGTYGVVETQPAGFNSVSDVDGGNPNQILPITVAAGQAVTGRDFVEEQPGSIAGSVLKDTNNDNIGDAPISGVTLTLVDGSGNPVDGDPNTAGVQPITTTTAPDGSYTFTNVPPGTYGVVETQPVGFASVSDVDGGNPNQILPITVAAGQAVTGRDFVEEQPGSIGGSVLNDTNNDDVGDAPISGVTLTLVDGSGNPVDGDPNTAGVQPITTTTAPNGSYTFTNVPPGTYGVVETQPAGYNSLSDVDGGNPNQILPITVAAGQAVTGRDFVEEQPGSIAGTVRSDTNNDDTGDAPISGVTLTLVDGSGNPIDSDPNTAGVQPTTTTTAPDGSYSFTNLPPGTYGVVESQPAGFASVSDVDGGNPNQILPITVAAGQAVTGRDFVEEQPGSIAGTVRKDTNNDDIGDAPISGVTLTLVDGSGNPIDSDPNTAGVQPTTTTTAPDGSYSFTSLPPGTYGVVETQPAGFASVSDVDGGNPNQISPISLAAGQAITGRDFLEEQPGSIAGSVLKDTNNDDTGDAPISGVTLTLVDSSGNPVDGDPNTAGVQPITTTTAPDGSYSFTNLPPGTYGVVETQPSGYNSISDVDGGNPNQILPITVAAGQAVTGRDFVEEQPGSIAGSVLKDTNNDDTGDAPISGVTLTLVDSSGNPVDSDPNTAGVQPITTTTAPDGSYTFTNLPPGTYGVVETQPAGFASVSDVDGGNPNQILPITVAAGQAIVGRDFVEVQPGSIAGSVLKDTNNDDSGDAPISGVTLTLVDSSGNPVDGDPNTAGVQPITTTTAPDGSYTFANVPPGTYGVVETQPGGYNSVSDVDGGNPNQILPITVAAGQAVTGHDFVEEQPGTIAGSVLKDTNNDDTGDAPISGVTLTLVDGSGNPVDGDTNTTGVQPITTTTAPDGTYTFTNVPPGTYGVVETQPAGFNSVSDVDGGNPNQILPITVIAGQAVTGRDFVEEQPGSIAGTVRQDTNNDDTGDAPISGVTLTLVDGSGNPVDSDPNTAGVQLTTTTTAPDGSYSFTNLPPGTYGVVETQPAGFISVSDVDGGNPNQILPITVAAGQAVTGRDFVEEQPGTIAGYVLADTDNDNAGDTPISGVILTLVDGSGNPIDGDPNTPGLQPITTTTAADGSYSFTNVAPGTYGVLQTQPAGYSSVSDVDGGNPDQIQTVTVNPGQTVNGRDFLEKPAKPTDWATWQSQNALGGSNGPTQNPDGDIYDNLQEFAFCFAPNSGVNPRCPLEVLVDQDGLMNAEVNVVHGLVGTTVTLEYISDLALSSANGGGWTPVTTIFPSVTSNGDGTDKLLYANLESIPALANGKGFVRLKVDLASPATTSRTYAAGWMDRTITGACETYSNPFLECEVFSGTVDSNTASSLDVTTAVGTSNFASVLVLGKSYYVEVLSGPFAGHRWNVIGGSTANTIAVGSGTKALTVDALAGASVIVREAKTIGGLFPPALYKAGSTPNNSDKVLIYDANSVAKWSVYYLADMTSGGMGIHWVKQGDNTLANQDGFALDACQGIFIHHRGAAISTTQVGHVRQNAMACPLNAGQNLVGAGFPIDQSYVDRAMTWTGTNFNGFVGGLDPVRADNVLFWKGDTTLNAENYTTYWLVNAGFDPYRRWSLQGDNALNSQDLNKVFKATRASFYKSTTGNPNYVVPTGWTP